MHLALGQWKPYTVVGVAGLEVMVNIGVSAGSGNGWEICAAPTLYAHVRPVHATAAAATTPLA